jgi:hypothetical protein
MRALAFAALLSACDGKTFLDGPVPIEPLPNGPVSPGPTACVDLKRTFERTVWSAFMAKDCGGCHLPDGSAIESNARFVLQRETTPNFVEQNIAALREMTRITADGLPWLLAKARGVRPHGGGSVLEVDGTKDKALRAFLALAESDAPRCQSALDDPLKDVPLLSPKQTLRKAFVGLAGQLPPADLLAKVTDEASLAQAITAIFHTPGFDEWLRDFWNDQLLVRKGLITSTPGVFDLRQEDFPRAAHYHKVNQPDGATAEEYWIAVSSLVDQPLRLISFIVREDRPFTEVLTANYTVMNPQLMDVFGLAPQSRITFKDFDQWRKIDALTFRRGLNDAFDLPLAGILTTSSFLGRYPSTPTNRSRARARVIYQVFLGTDLFQLSKRDIDTSSLSSIINPESNTAACSVCHRVMDPVAGIFRGFEEHPDGFAGFSFNPTRPWHGEMKAPGLGTTVMPAEDYGAAARWGAHAIVKDPRFPLALAKAALEGVTGARLMAYPTNTSASTFERDLDAWDAQDEYLRWLAQRFVQSNFSYRALLRDIVTGPFYRGIGPSTNGRLDEMLGFGKPLSPEQLSKKLFATTGVGFVQGWYTNYTKGFRPYDYLTDAYVLQAGGLDSVNVSKRSSDLGPLRSAVLERMAAFVSCRATSFDFSLPPSSRRLFPSVEPTFAPTKQQGNQWVADANGEAAVRKGLVFLFDRLLGETLDPASPRVDEALALFTEVHQSLAEAKNTEFVCAATLDVSAPNIDASGVLAPYSHPALPAQRQITTDPTFTIRAWQAVVWYLLSEPAFFLE